MLTADSEFQFGFFLAPLPGSIVYEFAYTSLIKAGKRVFDINFFALIFVIEQTHIVAT